MLEPQVLFLLTWTLGKLCLADGACLSGWDSVGSRCYKFTPSIPSMKDEMAYSEASSSCSSIGGKLVVFNDSSEMEAVVNSEYAKQYMESKLGPDSFGSFWVGCTDQAVEGTFECEDGTQLDINSDLWYTANGDPNSGKPGGSPENCGYLSAGSLGVRDVSCSHTYFALCEVEALPDPTTAPHRSGFYSMAKDKKGSPVIGYCLTNHVMKTIHKKSKLRCAVECGKEPGCKSFNYRDGLCELNTETKHSAGSNYFSYFDGCLYYEPI